MSINSGKTMTFILSIPDPVNSFQIPVDVNWVILKNTGGFPVRFKFDDDGPNDYWELAAGEVTPAPIHVQGGTNFNTDGIGGPTTLMGIAWG